MRRLAEDVFLLRGRPPNAVNVYLVGDMIVDAGTRHAARRILTQVRGRPLRAHALTHAHPDHRGSSHELCETLAIPLWCGSRDVPLVADPPPSGRPRPSQVIPRLLDRAWAGSPHPVARTLSEGDEVCGFEVLEVPGHSPGHIAFWRASDRVLILGDVLNNMHLLTGVPGLHEPPHAFSDDPARNRESARRIAALRPALACFGHGPPLRDADRLARFVARLPA